MIAKAGNEMEKDLSLFDGVSIIMGIILGAGIFITPKEIMAHVGSVWGSMMIWTLCGLITTLGAISYTELGTIFAESGGDYHYLNETYGPLPAFLFLWGAIFTFIPCTNAIFGITIANNVWAIYSDCPVNIWVNKLLAAVAICFFTFLNAYSVKFTTKMQNLFIFMKLTSCVCIIVCGFFWILDKGLDNLKDGWAHTNTDVGDWSIAMYSAIFSFSGWNYLNIMTEELQDPLVNLPRAIYISLPLNTFIYFFVNLSYLIVLGRQGVLTSEAVAVNFADHTLGVFKPLMPIAALITIMCSLSVNIMTSSRICFAGARNGHMPELLSHINTKCITPIPSLVFLMLMSLLMLIPNSLTAMITFNIFVESLFTTLTCSTVLWLRYKKPTLPRPIKVKLWIPATYVFVSVVLLTIPVLSQPVAIIAGVLLTLTGVPVFFMCIKSKSTKIEKVSGA